MTSAEHPLLATVREQADAIRALAADAKGAALSGYLRELADAEDHIAALERGEPVCRECGGSSFRAWYPVDEGQGIDVERAEDGTLTYDYNGITESGESGANTEYWCLDCDSSARTLEYLVGDTDEDDAEPDDAGALDAIHALLDGREWDSDTADDIAAIVRATGREIREPLVHAIDCDMGADCTCGAEATTDRYGRTWNLPSGELCPECGQPDNCGDCTHEPITAEQAAELGANDNERGQKC